MAEILTSVALEWATQSNIVFYVYFEEDRVLLDPSCYVYFAPFCTQSHTEVRAGGCSIADFLCYVFHLSCLT
jgi:hypothetical protein